MKNHEGLPAWMSPVARLLVLVSLALVAIPAFAGVPAKGTEILWDRYGIPHIFAPDHPSLFYAYGYSQMEAHAALLLRLYAQARGRGAEFYGDRQMRDTRSPESYLESDRWVRTNGIPERAKVWASEQSLEFAPLLRAFVAGLNAWGDRTCRFPQRPGESCAAGRNGRCARARIASNPLRLDRQPGQSGSQAQERE